MPQSEPDSGTVVVFSAFMQLPELMVGRSWTWLFHTVSLYNKQFTIIDNKCNLSNGIIWSSTSNTHIVHYMERNQINNETKLSIKTAIYMYAEIQTCDIVSSV